MGTVHSRVAVCYAMIQSKTRRRTGNALTGRHHRKGHAYSQEKPAGITQEMWDWFQAVDKNHSGRISVQELQKALVHGNCSAFNEETCRLMVGMFDINCSGRIDIHEFSQLWNYIQVWKTCFDSYGRESDTIDAEGLHQAYNSFGFSLSPEFCQVVIKKFDRTDNQHIRFDDFIQTCVMFQCMTTAFRAKDKEETGTVTINYDEFLEMVIDTTIKK